MGQADDTPFREIEVRSAAVTAAGFGLALSGIGAAMLWLVFSFPTGAATDIAKTTVDVLAGEACLSALRAAPTTAPGLVVAPTTVPGAATTSTSVPVACLPSPSPTPATTAPAPGR